jgi:hypothetical protein
VNEEMLDRILQHVEKVGTQALIAQAQVGLLTNICGALMAEVAKLSPDPQETVDRLAGAVSGATSEAASSHQGHEVTLAMTRLADEVIGIAETALGKPYAPGSRNKPST